MSITVTQSECEPVESSTTLLLSKSTTFAVLVTVNTCGTTGYHPHPKNGEGAVFTGVCLFRGGRGGTTWPSHKTSTSPMSFPGGGEYRSDYPLARIILGYPPPQCHDRLGYPRPGQDWGTLPPPETEQQSEYLLRGGRFGPCVHAGVLSC